MSRAQNLQLRLPVAVLRLSLAGPTGADQAPPSALAGQLLERPGLFQLREGLFVVAPVAGDEAVFDAALAWVRGLEREWAAAGSASTEQGLTALLLPGVALIESSSATLLPDHLLEDLERQPPVVGPGVFLTGRATKMLEFPPELTSATEYSGPSGKAVSLFRAGAPRFDHLPWRNPEVFGQRPQAVERTELGAGLDGLLGETVTRISGPMGCGKTRLLWEHLASGQRPRLWLRVHPPRANITLGEQVIRQLLLPSDRQVEDQLHPRLERRFDREQIQKALESRRESTRKRLDGLLAERAIAALDHLGTEGRGPLFVVVDDLHVAESADQAFIGELLQSRTLGVTYRLVLVGRSGSAWPSQLEPFPLLDVPPMSAEEMSDLTAQITQGLAIPEATHERFIDSVRGYPFAFEEGLFALIHERHLRRVYGSFFFGGDETTEFQPSHRFARHVEAEVSRLGPSLPVRLLSLMETAVPAAELAAGASILGEEMAPDWENSLLAARILRTTESPWGPGVEIVSKVNARALASGMPEEAAPEARRALGELLSLSGSSGEAHWHSYRLLAGSPEALEPLLRIFATPYAAQIPREKLLEALVTELEGLQKSRDDPERELQLLWRLLPLARRVGKLQRYEAYLARGMDLASSDPPKLLALAGIKAEIEQEAGRYAEAEATLQHALKAAAGSDVRRKALLMIQLGRLYLRQNRYADAERLFASLHKAFEESGSSALAATCLFFLGNIALHTARLEEADQLHSRALEERRRQQLTRPVGSSLSALGAVAAAAGNYPLAMERYREAQELLEKHGREGEVAFALLGLGRALSRIGDYTGATGPVRRALAQREGRDDATGEAIARLAVARNYLDLGRPDMALEEARKAHFQLSMVSAEGPLARADELLGKIHLNQRRFEEARRRLETAFTRYGAQRDAASLSFVAADLIEVCISQEDADGIRRYTTELKNAIKQSPPTELEELLHYRLYRGLDWLTEQGHKVGDPISFLDRAYRTLLRKASHLDHEARHRFLLQVADNHAIVESATKLGLDAQTRRSNDAQKPAR